MIIIHYKAECKPTGGEPILMSVTVFREKTTGHLMNDTGVCNNCFLCLDFPVIASVECTV